MIKDVETIVKVFDILGKNPESSQRDIARSIGISVGKVNHVLKALILKGFVKTENFINSKNKWAYRYILTSRGMKEKVKITRQFVKKKIEEYERLLNG